MSGLLGLIGSYGDESDEEQLNTSIDEPLKDEPSTDEPSKDEPSKDEPAAAANIFKPPTINPAPDTPDDTESTELSESKLYGETSGETSGEPRRHSREKSGSRAHGVDTISGSEEEMSEDDGDSKDGDEVEGSPQQAEPAAPPPRKMNKLVSYVNEDDYEESESEEEEEEVSSPGHAGKSPRSMYRNMFAAGGEIHLPDAPPGRCSRQLQEKILHLGNKVKVGYDLSASIQNRKDFRNPGIYEKLLQFCAIDEKGTNYPPHLYDPSIFGPESFYDELAKAQKTEMDKRERERKERTKVEFQTGVKKTSESSSSEPKRKSKWDTQPAVLPAHIVHPPPPVSLTTSASGTKATVISSSGSISKKK